MTPACPACAWPLRQRAAFGSNICYECCACRKFYTVGTRFLPTA